MRPVNQAALIVAFYLSKFDSIAYQNLGYKTITLTHQIIGHTLRIKASTIQNMRDEFDPHHKNSRKGWWQRKLSPSRQKILISFSEFTEPQLLSLVKKILATSTVPINVLTEIEGKNLSVSRSKNWTATDLAIALDTYLYMLRLQFGGIPFTTSHLTKSLLEGPLAGKTGQDLRKKMQHISYMFKKRALPLVKDYTPISASSNQIMEEIDTLISKRAKILSEIIEQGVSSRPIFNDLSSKLTKLELTLNSFEMEPIYGLGHNNPPEPIDDDLLRIGEVKESLIPTAL